MRSRSAHLLNFDNYYFIFGWELAANMHSFEELKCLRWAPITQTCQHCCPWLVNPLTLSRLKSSYLPISTLTTIVGWNLSGQTITTRRPCKLYKTSQILVTSHTTVPITEPKLLRQQYRHIISRELLYPEDLLKRWCHAFGTSAIAGSCHKRQKPQSPTPQTPIRNRQTRKVANAKGLNRNTNLT